MNKCTSHIALKVPKLVHVIVLTGYFPFIPDELKDEKVRLVPSTGHLTNMDQPGIYNKILKNFLENL